MVDVHVSRQLKLKIFYFDFSDLPLVAVKRPSTVTDLEATALIHDGIMVFTALHYKCHVSGGDSILILNAASVRANFVKIHP